STFEVGWREVTCAEIRASGKAKFFHERSPSFRCRSNSFYPYKASFLILGESTHLWCILSSITDDTCITTTSLVCTRFCSAGGALTLAAGAPTLSLPLLRIMRMISRCDSVSKSSISSFTRSDPAISAAERG
ncbi:hypothetical protein PMAYCL1PPCAC_27883, partial [Pristionchus mayeri]